MKDITIRNLKGTTDYLNEEELLRNKIIDTLKKTFEKYGYLPLETPILNYYDLLAYKYDDNAEILNETYKLTDQGGRSLALRYDLTIPFCKVIALNKDLNLPFKRYEIGRVFRNGPVKAGRMREFYQCDIDVVGLDSRISEIEMLTMAIHIFKKLNIDIIIKWNNRKLMNGIIAFLGIDEKLSEKVINIIDHMEKISKEEMIECFNEIGIDNSKAIKLLDLFNKSFDEYKEIFKDTNITFIKEGLAEIEEMISLIKKFNIDSSLVFTPTLARGLSIYTGLVFEVFDKKERITSSLAGGGRYNNIIGEFMKEGDYPALGMTFGLEPIYAILKDEKMDISITDCLIIPMDTEVESLMLANKLREYGIRVIVEMKKRKVKKCFEYASKNNIKYVIVIGSDEINNNTFTLKNMFTKEQFTLTYDELISHMK